MKYLCPICGNVLTTEDENLYTCVNCDEIFTIDDLEEEYGLQGGCDSCHLN